MGMSYSVIDGLVINSGVSLFVGYGSFKVIENYTTRWIAYITSFH